MQNSIFRKGMVLGIVVFLIGISIVPSTANVININSITKDEFTLISLKSGKTLYVGGSGPNNYTKIQDAVDDSTDGDTVFVYAGFYVEILTIKTSINLIGEDKNTTIIDGNDTWLKSTIWIINDGVSVSNFTIQNGSIFGIDIHKNNTKIFNNIITKNNHGIQLVGGHGGIRNNLISNNLIIKNSNEGVLTEYTAFKTNICNNIFIKNYIGLYMYGGSNHIVYHNTFQDNYKMNIKLKGGCDNNIISHNIIQGSDYGFYIVDSSFNQIEKNTIRNNTKNIFIFGEYNEFNTFSKNNIYQNNNEPIFDSTSLIKNKWKNNYWGEPINPPKIIYGTHEIILFRYYDGYEWRSVTIEIPGYEYDWNPAKEPHDISDSHYYIPSHSNSQATQQTIRSNFLNRLIRR